MVEAARTTKAEAQRREGPKSTEDGRRMERGKPGNPKPAGWRG
jgi:hypothetical protein